MDTELEKRTLLSRVKLYQQYLSPERMRDMAMTNIAWNLYLWMTDNQGRGDWDVELQELVTASDELLALANHEGMDAEAFDALWMDRASWRCPALVWRVRRRIADLARTFTDQAEAGPLFDLARDLGPADG